MWGWREWWWESGGGGGGGGGGPSSGCCWASLPPFVPSLVRALCLSRPFCHQTWTATRLTPAPGGVGTRAGRRAGAPCGHEAPTPRGEASAASARRNCLPPFFGPPLPAPPPPPRLTRRLRNLLQEGNDRRRGGPVRVADLDGARVDGLGLGSVSRGGHGLLRGGSGGRRRLGHGAGRGRGGNQGGEEEGASEGHG